MKKSIYLFLVTLITVAFVNIIPAKAELSPQNPAYTSARENAGNCDNNGYDIHRSTGPGTTNDNVPANPSGSTNLPINNGVIFLMIAGLSIGVITIKKYKSLKPVAVIS
jgi:hypothetical protein